MFDDRLYFFFLGAMLISFLNGNFCSGVLSFVLCAASLLISKYREFLDDWRKSKEEQIWRIRETQKWHDRGRLAAISGYQVVDRGDHDPKSL